MASIGVIAVGLLRETELFVKLPVVTRDQYSVLLFDANDASVVPPEFAVKASACAVIVPVFVVGLTNAKGR